MPKRKIILTGRFRFVSSKGGKETKINQSDIDEETDEKDRNERMREDENMRKDVREDGVDKQNGLKKGSFDKEGQRGVKMEMQSLFM